MTGTWMDRTYDPETPRFFPYAVYYPIVYWMILSVTTFIALPYLFKKPGRQAVTWKTLHDRPST
jgi:biofilm PGA synthesis N-glycosyltransferase PgaC